jgi:hypothetical protein
MTSGSEPQVCNATLSSSAGHISPTTFVPLSESVKLERAFVNQLRLRRQQNNNRYNHACIISLFPKRSQLNGQNGEATNSDDVSRPEFLGDFTLRQWLIQSTNSSLWGREQCAEFFDVYLSRTCDAFWRRKFNEKFSVVVYNERNLIIEVVVNGPHSTNETVFTQGCREYQMRTHSGEYSTRSSAILSFVPTPWMFVSLVSALCDLDEEEVSASSSDSLNGTHGEATNEDDMPPKPQKIKKGPRNQNPANLIAQAAAEICEANHIIPRPEIVRDAPTNLVPDEITPEPPSFLDEIPDTLKRPWSTQVYSWAEKNGQIYPITQVREDFQTYMSTGTIDITSFTAYQRTPKRIRCLTVRWENRYPLLMLVCAAVLVAIHLTSIAAYTIVTPHFLVAVALIFTAYFRWDRRRITYHPYGDQRVTIERAWDDYTEDLRLHTVVIIPETGNNVNADVRLPSSREVPVKACPATCSLMRQCLVMERKCCSLEPRFIIEAPVTVDMRRCQESMVFTGGLERDCKVAATLHQKIRNINTDETDRSTGLEASLVSYARQAANATRIITKPSAGFHASGTTQPLNADTSWASMT